VRGQKAREGGGERRRKMGREKAKEGERRGERERKKEKEGER
jgi:hypothetical protein